MKHEKFKLFPIVADPEYVAPDVIEFLRSGKTLKSISVATTFNEYGLLAIGYTDEPTEETYIIRAVDFGGYLGWRTDELEAKIEESANETDGVLCKSILIEDGNIIVYFLIHEKDFDKIETVATSPLEAE